MAGNAADDWIRPEEVPDRADALLLRLDLTKPDAAAQAAVQRIEAGLAVLRPDLDTLLAGATGGHGAKPSLAEIADVRREIEAAAAPLAGWKSELTAATKRVAERLDELARAERLWSATAARSETNAAGEAVVKGVQNAEEAVREGVQQLRAWQAQLLALAGRVGSCSIDVEIVLENLDASTVAEAANLFVPDRAPLWRGGFGSELRSEIPRVPAQILSYNRGTLAYAQKEERALAVQALLALVLMFVFRGMSTRARERLAGADDTSRAARVLERPYAIALMLVLLASPAMHPLAPQRFMRLLAMIALVPMARIVTQVTERIHLAALAGLFVLLFLDRFSLALAPLPAFSLAALLVALAIAVGLVFWFGRRSRLASGSPWLRRAANATTLGLCLALLAGLGGFTELSTVLGRALLGSGVAALYVYAGQVALSALLAYAITSPTFRRSHIVARDQLLLRRRLDLALRWLGVGLWFSIVLQTIGLRDAAIEAFRALLQAGVSFGAVSISLGGLLAFVLTLLGAMLLARIVNEILEVDVYPRTALPRGIPYALSTLVRYGFYSLGFLLALAAAGVQLGQLAIMLGGLGVGIGLGLQDLVKNFAAGLTLLFERRVHVGDSVQIPSQSIFGRVVAIGIRATVIRNFNGVEVVVPNNDLVSGSVTNWTLSDRLHRIEVAVGVAYGTDPDRVIELLLEVAGSHERMLAYPAPQALFRGFGESSLDFLLRAWTDDDYEPRTSELALAVHRRLCEAEIAIPFPQRDLHLASVSSEARAALSEVGTAGRGHP